jgi:hypothetical protein
VQRHRTSKNELDSWRALIARDLKDAALPGLSADRRFATAYNAVLQTSSMLIACSGYRVTARSGHHQVSLDCIRLIFGSSIDSLADYFESCRRKRNAIDYSHSHIASESEADEMLVQAKTFFTEAEAWIAKRHPSLR